jgi:hypothetical protein
MQAHSPTYPGFEELASRESNGIAVQLLWNRTSNAVLVAVVDQPASLEFALDVGEASPMDVFRHPYAYAAFRHLHVMNEAQLSAARA